MNGIQDCQKSESAPNVSRPIGTRKGSYALNYKDISNKRFGLLVAIKRVTPAGVRRTKWECKCDCGKRTVVEGSKLRNGHTKSCGCLKVAISRKAMTTHGNSNSPTYRSWMAMLRRCRNKNYWAYRWYGGRNITVCDRWVKYDCFLSDMGEKPAGKEIDRINNELGYSPENCRWVTHKENCNNRRKHG